MIGEAPNPAGEAGRTPPVVALRAPRGRLALRLLLEFMTIVTGVLVALAVDQWVEGRHDRSMERGYLLRLQEDMRADSAVTTEAFDHLDRKDAGLERLARFRAGEGITEDEASALVTNLIAARVRGIPGARTRATWDDLRSTGRLALIRDPEVRAALDRYYAVIDRNEAILRSDFSEYPRAISRVLPGALQASILLDRPIPEALVRAALDRLLVEPGLDRHLDAERGYGALQRVALTRVAMRGAAAMAALQGALR